MQKFQELLKKWRSNETMKHVWVLFSGTTVAQAIPVLATLLLARIYPEKNFGVFFIFSAVNMVISTFSTLYLELSVVLPKEEKEAAQLWSLSILSSFALSILLVVIALIGAPFLERFNNFKELGAWIFLLPISVFFSGIFQVSSYWFNRKNKYRLISVGRIIRSGSYSVLQLLLGVFRFFTSGLIVGFVSGYVVGGIYNAAMVLKNHKLSTFKINKNQIQSLFKKYLNIPVFNTSMGILNTISVQLPIFVLSGFFSLESTAHYGLAHRFIGLPVYLIGQSVGQVFFNKASKLYNQQGDIHALLFKTMKRLFLFAVIPFVLLFIFSPWVFSLLLGEQWYEAGLMARYLSPYLLLSFVVAPVSYIVTILNKQKQILVYEIIVLAARYIAIYLGFRIFNEAKMSIIFFSGINIFFYFLLITYYHYISKHYLDGRKGYL